MYIDGTTEQSQHSDFSTSIYQIDNSASHVHIISSYILFIYVYMFTYLHAYRWQDRASTQASQHLSDGQKCIPHGSISLSLSLSLSLFIPPPFPPLFPLFPRREEGRKGGRQGGYTHTHMRTLARIGTYMHA